MPRKYIRKTKTIQVLLIHNAMIQARMTFPYLHIISPKISKRTTKEKRLSILTSTPIKYQLEDKEKQEKI